MALVDSIEPGKSEMSDVRERGSRHRGRWLALVVALFVLVLVAGFLAVGWLQQTRPIPPLPVADVSSERLLGGGSVVGFAAPFETHAWLGIPFARPPVGDLRWRSPQPPEAWADTLDALEFGEPCLQLSSPLAGVSADDDQGIGGSEDCLTLNIWAPRRDAEEVVVAHRPVMVWIHGGANTRGAAGLPMYDGARLAGTQDMVVVSLQYRLGPFGWFSHPALRALTNDPLEASGNFGILDQIHALEWIEANIEEFGGDPANVTIFGQSAGGTDVFALLLADAAEGLFHRAIAQSASTDTVSRSDAENLSTDDLAPGHRHSSLEVVAALIESAGVVPGREAAGRYAAELPPSDLVEFIRNRPGRDILNAYRDPERPNVLDVPSPIRDGNLLPAQDMLDALRAGRFHPVPVILGSTRDEKKLTLSQDREHATQRFGVLYRIRDRADYARRARFYSELETVRGVIRPATAIGEAGWGEVYVYRFDWDDLPNVLGQNTSELIGAGHGFELPFLFGTFDLGSPVLSRLLYPEEGKADREALADSMMSYWAEFAEMGRPGRGRNDDLPNWPASMPESGEHVRWLVFDDLPGGGIRAGETSLSRDEVIAAVDDEEGLGQHEKCSLFRDLFGDRPDWDLEEWLEMGRSGCAGIDHGS